MKKLLGICLATIMSFSISTEVFAATTDTSKTNGTDITIQGGEFSLASSNITTFGNVVLSEQAKTYKTSFDNKFTVKDLRGTQAGWRIDVSATPFSDGTSTLPKGSLSLDPLSSIQRVGTGQGSLPEKATNTNKIIDDGVVTIAKAVAGGGMGVFDLVFPVNALSVVIDPTTAKINTNGLYQSTITWNLVQAP